MKTLFGMLVVVNPMCENVPRMQVSTEFARIQSPELTASTNAWMREFFGVSDLLYMITDPATHKKSVVMGPKAHSHLLMVVP